MNVSLGETLDRFVEELVKSGMYQSQSEVLRDGLRLLKDREDLRKLRLAELKREIQIGIDQLQRGETVPHEEVFAEIRKMSEQRRKAGGR